MVGTTSDWEDELGRWLEPFLERDRRYVDAEERQALGRCRCAICFGIGQDGQLPDAGVTDWRAARCR